MIAESGDEDDSEQNSGHNGIAAELPADEIDNLPLWTPLRVPSTASPVSVEEEDELTSKDGLDHSPLLSPVEGNVDPALSHTSSVSQVSSLVADLGGSRTSTPSTSLASQSDAGKRQPSDGNSLLGQGSVSQLFM